MRARPGSDDRRVIFLHLPKTGGSTLRRIIEREYPADAIFTIDPDVSGSIDRLLGLPPARLEAIRAVIGHAPYGLHEIVPWPAAYVTLVREPVDRIVSHFAFAQRSPESPLHAEAGAGSGSLGRYVREAPSAPFFNDGQTRLLGSESPRDARPARPETLTRALARIDDWVGVIGLTDRFGDSLAMMRSAFGWSRVRPGREKPGWNRPGWEDIPDSDLREVREHNRMDAELYAAASLRFERDRISTGLHGGLRRLIGARAR